MLKNDSWIREQALKGMIEPFSEPVRTGLSYGLGSFGYDLRLSPDHFLVYRHIPGKIADPKDFDRNLLQPQACIADDRGWYFLLPGHSYALGVAMEKLVVPPNVTVVCLGKSTYARMGIILNATPAEAGWEGHLTLEISNSSASDARIYAKEGICQLLFLEGEIPSKTYEDFGGKYQGQECSVVPPRVM